MRACIAPGPDVVSVNIGSGPAFLRRTAAENGITFPMAADQLQVAAHRYGVVFFPTTFVIDAQGIVRERITGQLTEAVVDAELASLLRDDHS